MGNGAQGMVEALKVREDEEQGGLQNAAQVPVSWVTNRWQRMRQFFHDVRVELKNVSWPTRDDVKSTTVVVILTVFVFGVFLFLVDYGVSHAVTRILNSFKP